MSDDIRVLDLGKMDGAARPMVDAMVAELQGTAPSPRGASSGRTVWTWQFAASGKGCQPTS
jgi:hypothetical protein